MYYTLLYLFFFGVVFPALCCVLLLCVLKVVEGLDQFFKLPKYETLYEYLFRGVVQFRVSYLGNLRTGLSVCKL